MSSTLPRIFAQTYLPLLSRACTAMLQKKNKNQPTALQKKWLRKSRAAASPQMGSCNFSFTQYTVYILLKTSCFLTLAPCVFNPCTQIMVLAGQERLHLSVARGAGSPSSGSWRPYTTTLMTYQHFTHIFPTTIKTFWTCMPPNLQTTVHRTLGPDHLVPTNGPNLQPARPGKSITVSSLPPDLKIAGNSIFILLSKNFFFSYRAPLPNSHMSRGVPALSSPAFWVAAEMEKQCRLWSSSS